MGRGFTAAFAACAAVVLLAPGAGLSATEPESFGWHPADTRKGRPNIRVLCFNNNHPSEGRPADVRSSPRKCSLYRRGYDYEAAGAVHMRKLRWKHWGGQTTVAKGQYAEPMDIEEPWKPIRVRLKKPVERCGRAVYSRAVFHSRGYRTGFPIWIC